MHSLACESRVKYLISYPCSVIDCSILESCHSDKGTESACLSGIAELLNEMLNVSSPLKENSIIIFLRTVLE